MRFLKEDFPDKRESWLMQNLLPSRVLVIKAQNADVLKLRTLPMGASAEIVTIFKYCWARARILKFAYPLVKPLNPYAWHKATLSMWIVQLMRPALLLVRSRPSQLTRRWSTKSASAYTCDASGAQLAIDIIIPFTILPFTCLKYLWP